MDQIESLSWTSHRRYGVEIETNADDRRDFQEFRLHDGELPLGVHRIGLLINNKIHKEVLIDRWHHTHNNKFWEIKPDSSCGIEICSPVLRGKAGLDEIVQVIQAIKDDNDTKIDKRCSVHIHFEVRDFTAEEFCKLMCYWTKCEAVFIDAVPHYRKSSRYCQSISHFGVLDVYNNPGGYSILDKLGLEKYYSVNAYHYNKKRRETLEFRLLGYESCTDFEGVKNWIILLSHFIDRVKEMLHPGKYDPHDIWSGLCWLNPNELFEILGFDGSYSLSTELEEVRDWFLISLYKNVNTGKRGIWSPEVRRYSYLQIVDLMEKFGLKERLNDKH